MDINVNDVARKLMKNKKYTVIKHFTRIEKKIKKCTRIKDNNYTNNNNV